VIVVEVNATVERVERDHRAVAERIVPADVEAGQESVLVQIVRQIDASHVPVTVAHTVQNAAHDERVGHLIFISYNLFKVQVCSGENSA